MQTTSAPQFNPLNVDPSNTNSTETTPDQPEQIEIRDLTLTQLLGSLFRAPGRTINALTSAFEQAESGRPEQVVTTVGTERRTSQRPRSEVAQGRKPRVGYNTPDDAADNAIDDLAATPLPDGESYRTVQFRESVRPSTITYTRTGWVSLALMLVISLFALASASALYAARPTDGSSDLPSSGLLLLLTGIGFGVLIGAEAKFGRLAAYTNQTRTTAQNNVIVLLIRAAFFLLAAFAAFQAWGNTTRNLWTPEGTGAWLISIAAAVFAFYDGEWAWVRWLRSIVLLPAQFLRSRLTFRVSWTLIALAVILIVCAVFRFGNLGAYPPDMTSDHVEKVRDAFFINNGARPIFLENNGGREVGFFYYLAILQQTLNLPYNYDLLKIGAGIISLITILVAYWMGRSLIGEEDQRLGNLTGLIMAALIAVSYWHIMLSRLGLRIVLMPLATMLLIIFLARGIRYNRRLDFIFAGLILGFSLYAYQAARMLPVLVIFAAFVALVVKVRSLRSFGQWAVNFAAVVLIAGAIFIPLGRYWYEYPDSFWSRSAGRLFGEPTEEVKDSVTGAVLRVREVPLDERIGKFFEALPKLRDNMVKSLNMFNYVGDVAWVTGSPKGFPQLDWVAGAFMIVGFGIVGARIFKRRDPVDLLLVGGLVIMLLPTALSIVFQIEVPSATRASGTLPIAYFVSALGLAFIVRSITVRTAAPAVRFIVYGVVTVLVIIAATVNTQTYFVEAMTAYRASTYPYRQAGQLLRAFSTSGVGSSGNAFFISYPNWWDHRALALEAGDPRWDNGIIETDMIAQLKGKMTGNVGTAYELRPDRQLLFFVHQNALATSLVELQTEFPGGTVTPVESFEPNKDFYLYTVPSVSCEWITTNIQLQSSFCNLTPPIDPALDVVPFPPQ